MELIQDATAIAAKMLHSVEVAGKTVTPGNLAYYAIQHLMSGRRSTGLSVVDVLAAERNSKAMPGSARWTNPSRRVKRPARASDFIRR